MSGRWARASAVLALVLAGCDPIHVIGGEHGDGGPDGGPDAGPADVCSSDAGCGCGFACAYSDDLRAPVCFRQTLSCAEDGGSPVCSDGGVCLVPLVGGTACAVARCFQGIGSTSCASDADCACGYSCTQSSSGGVCSPVATCTHDLDCGPGSCVEIYRNGQPCGVRQCVND